jgi:hypothetical protein
VYVNIGGNANVYTSQVTIDGVVASDNMAFPFGVGGGGGAVAATITTMGFNVFCAIAVSNCLLSGNRVGSTGRSCVELALGLSVAVLCADSAALPLSHQ